MRFLQGYYDTMDAGFVDEDGYVYIMSRSDDVINVAGHRLSTGALEEVRAFRPSPGRVLRPFSSEAGLVFRRPCCSTPPWPTAPWWGWKTS